MDLGLDFEGFDINHFLVDNSEASFLQDADGMPVEMPSLTSSQQFMTPFSPISQNSNPTPSPVPQATPLGSPNSAQSVPSPPQALPQIPFVAVPPALQASKPAFFQPALLPPSISALPAIATPTNFAPFSPPTPQTALPPTPPAAAGVPNYRTFDDEKYDDLDDFEDELSNFLEEKQKNQRSKKLKTEKGSLDVGKSNSVSLSRKQMLEISSEEYEALIRNIRATRTLSEDEEALYKEQKRLIKNREAAQHSRAKKKTQIDRLRKEINKIQNDNIQIEKAMERRESENEAMKGEINYLHSMIKKSEVLSSSFDAYNSWMVSGGKGSPSSLQHYNHPGQRANGSSSAAVSPLYLLLLLFCFRSYFNVNPVEGNQRLAFPFPPNFVNQISRQTSNCGGFDPESLNSLQNLLTSLQNHYGQKQLEEDLLNYLQSAGQLLPAGLPSVAPQVPIKQEGKPAVTSEDKAKEKITVKTEKNAAGTASPPATGNATMSAFAAGNASQFFVLELLRQAVALAAAQANQAPSLSSSQNLTHVK